MDPMLWHYALVAASIVIPICFAIYFYVKSREKIELRLFYCNDVEVAKLSEVNRKITVTYGTRNVDRVTTTKIWLWNRGARSLKRDDIPVDDPLTIVIHEKNSEVVILDYRILKASRGCAEFRIAEMAVENHLKLDFAYMDTKSGAVVEIQHTGTVHSIPRLDGIILGPKIEPKIRKSYRSCRDLRLTSRKFKIPSKWWLVWGTISVAVGVLVAILRITSVMKPIVSQYVILDALFVCGGLCLYGLSQLLIERGKAEPQIPGYLYLSEDELQ